MEILRIQNTINCLIFRLVFLGLREIKDEARAGWVCAQRRPLRALAHALQLFEPEYIFLGDDDTYFNYPLFSNLSGAFRAKLKNQIISYGNLGYGGITPSGFYVGGGGYLFGHAMVSQMTSKRLAAFQVYAPNVYTKSLSLYHALLRLEEKEKKINPTRESCIISPESGSRTSLPNARVPFVNISVRAIDICVSLLSNNNTCHHSDHAMTRCIVYGLGGVVQGNQKSCMTFADLMNSTGASDLDSVLKYVALKPLMCGYLISFECDPRIHLTCHRYRPASYFNSTPVRFRAR